MECLMNTTNVTTGRLKKVEMDAISLSQTFFVAYGMALIIGLSTACDTLFSQTVGSRSKKRTGMWLQKGLLIMNAISIVLCSIHLNLEPIYLLTGQFPEVARLASYSSAYMAPGLIMFANFQILLRYLQNIGIIYIPVLITFVVFAFNAVFQYVLIYECGFGYATAALSQSLSFGLMLLLTVAYILIWKKYEDTWDGFKRESLTSWWKFTRMALYGTGHYAFESFCLNVGIVVTGTMSKTLLAAQTVIYMISGAMFMIPYTLSVAVNIRIGQFLGQLNPDGAKRALKTGVMMAAFIIVISTILIETTANFIPRIYTNHEDVIEVVTKTLPFMMLVYFFDTFRGCTDGALRGCGRQSVGAIIIVIIFSLIAVPGAICLLLFTQLELIGYWIGTAVGGGLTLAAELIFLTCLDWNKEAVNAQERVLKAYKAKQIIDETSPLLPAPACPRRMPKESRSSSTNFEEMSCRAEVSDAEFRRLFILRSVTFAGCVLLLIASIVVNATVPHDLFVVLARNVTSV